MQNFHLLSDVIKRRDISNFIVRREAHPADDAQIAKLLLYTFSFTNIEKMPEVKMNESRILELVRVEERRKNGTVIVLELGSRIIATFSLIRPDSSMTEAWIPKAANLRCVAVDPDYHGLGFSAILLEEAQFIAKQWKAPAICLHVQGGARGLSSLYEKHGYRADPRGDFSKNGYGHQAFALPLDLHREETLSQ